MRKKIFLFALSLVSLAVGRGAGASVVYCTYSGGCQPGVVVVDYSPYPNGGNFVVPVTRIEGGYNGNERAVPVSTTEGCPTCRIVPIEAVRLPPGAPDFSINASNVFGSGFGVGRHQEFAFEADELANDLLCSDPGAGIEVVVNYGRRSVRVVGGPTFRGLVPRITYSSGGEDIHLTDPRSGKDLWVRGGVDTSRWDVETRYLYIESGGLLGNARSIYCQIN